VSDIFDEFFHSVIGNGSLIVPFPLTPPIPHFNIHYNGNKILSPTLPLAGSLLFYRTQE
jgi:hypothetical protein